MAMAPTVVVAGALANKPGNGGEAWVRTSWVRGFARLGWRVVFVEQIASAACQDATGAPCGFEASENRRWFDRVTAESGLTGHAAVIVDDGRVIHGLDRAELIRLGGSARLLLNIGGHLHWRPLFDRPARRVYVDIDPGFTQFWHAQGLAGPRLEGHDAFFTIGLSIGAPDCPIPTCGIAWRHVLPPVVVADWPADRPVSRSGFTTVASWRGPFGPVEYGGRTYGLKVHQFRRFLDLPGRTTGPFEIALAIHAGDAADRERLLAAGWRLTDPATVAGDPAAFRDYVAGSAAEFSVAQGIYVDTACGWVSDRTVRYLACGRPALVQDTGIGHHLPTGEGLVTFRTLDEAVAGAEDIRARYDHHRQAALALAHDRFDSDRVIARLIEESAG